MSKYIVTGGGTGGHLYPGLSIASELAKSGEVLYVASKNGNDREIVSELELNFPVQYWNLKGFYRSFTPSAILKNIINIFKLGIVSIQSIILLLRFRPTAVIGVGGYISFPLVFLGKIVGAKTIIHEQNSYPGVTNRTLGKYVNNVMITYKSSAKYFPQEKIVFTSSPRVDEASLFTGKKFYPETKMNPDRTNVLIVGGSLGAEALNEVIVKLAAVDKEKDYYLVTGTRYYQEYCEKGTANLFIIEYINNAFEYFATADVVVTRGGSTLLELIAMEKLTVAIPSPNVVADHQTTNAREFSGKGMIKQVSEANLQIACLLSVINDIIDNKEIYFENIRNHKPQNAMEEILKVCK